MADDNKYNDDDKAPKKGGEFKVPARTWVVWIAVFGGIILLMLLRDRMETQAELLTQWRFFQMVDSNQIAQATINYNPQDQYMVEITGKYLKADKDGNITKESGRPTEVPFRLKARLTPDMEE